MRIKTNLPHEAVGGETRVMFALPEFRKGLQNKNFLYVRFVIVKYLMLKNGIYQLDFMQSFDVLTDFQKKKILKQAAKLAKDHFQISGMKMKDNYNLDNIIFSVWDYRYCYFEGEEERVR